MNTLYNHYSITDFIPQRAPFIMVDKVIVCEEKLFKTTFEVKEDNLFLEKGILSESAILENIAQTCAAGMGCYSKMNTKEEVKTGFIGSINKVEVFAPAHSGDTIHTEVTILQQLGNIFLIEGIAKTEKNQVLVKCQMKIVA